MVSAKFEIRDINHVISPEDYVATLGLKRLLDVTNRLTEDTDIADLRTGQRKGEVCLLCKRIDP